ncbi:chemotaxis protein CheB [Deinococcus aquaticus]|uniref:chemotaxis protein CheB n=1 Tax=Deinococcus aquaticus TaxID=328692 RepID=UPI003F458529
MTRPPSLTVLVTTDPQQRLEGQRLLPTPRLLTTSVVGALAYLNREGLRGATLLLSLPPPDLDLGWVQAQAQALDLRVILVGGPSRPGLLGARDLAAAAQLCREAAPVVTLDPAGSRSAAPRGVVTSGPVRPSLVPSGLPGVGAVSAGAVGSGVVSGGAVSASAGISGAGVTSATGGGVPSRQEPGLRLTLIGASTGGPRVLATLLRDLRPVGAVVIAQHISEGFGANLTQWLGTLTAAPVVTARDGLPLQGGHVYVAPDSHHVEVSAGALRIRPGRPGQEHLPSIDTLFASACSHRGPVTAALLTGMGSDGADGLAQLHRTGATTLVQSPDSATVPSMPQQALARVQPSGVLDPDALRAALRRLA